MQLSINCLKMLLIEDNLSRCVTMGIISTNLNVLEKSV